MSFSSALSAILYMGAQFLEAPTMALLILLFLLVVFCIGWLIVEYFTERRRFKVNHRAVMVRLHDADYSGIEPAIREAGLLKSQSDALVRIAENMGLPDEELFAMSQVELENLERRYRRRVNLTDTMSKVSPMLGLMGTLIPLGPGIVAMGQGDLNTLSASIGIAFNTTIAGLVVAVISVIVSRVRRTWYGQYSTMMTSLMTCLLEEASRAHEDGKELPYKPWRELLGSDGAPKKREGGAPRGVRAKAGAVHSSVSTEAKGNARETA